MKGKKLNSGEYPSTQYHTKTDSHGKRWMICSNSEPDGRYWKGHLCSNYSQVGDRCIEVLCWRCTSLTVEPPVVKQPATASDKPKGWKFMKEFVAADGTVYHKGIEQPALKGTLLPTVIEPKEEKKKLSKKEKAIRYQEVGSEILRIKGEMVKETKKTRRAELARQLSRANRELKKLS